MSGISCGIVGLPNVGKSTLFSALTENQVDAENYPFCTIDPNIGVVSVPDSRLEALSKVSKSAKEIPASIHFVDIAGLVEGASQGEGLGNQFLANIRETDAIIHVVRCFEDSDIIHVAGKVNPISDIEVINTELILADLQMVDKAIQKTERQAKIDPKAKFLLETLKEIQAHLNENMPLRSYEFKDDDLKELSAYPFLTRKPVLYVANTSDANPEGAEKDHLDTVYAYAEKEGGEVVPLCVAIEYEIANLPKEDRKEMLDGMGLDKPGLEKLVQSSFNLLGLISYLTTGEIETRAWVITKGMLAPQAAGKIHSDIQKGFIRAEVITFDDVIAFGGRSGAKENGKVRTEGKDYTVQDGDVILFLHN